MDLNGLITHEIANGCHFFTLHVLCSKIIYKNFFFFLERYVNFIHGTS